MTPQGRDSEVKRFDRSQRVSDEIQRVVAEAIQRDVKDYDLTRVTITRCEVNRDLSEATIRYSVLGGEDERHETAAVIAKVAGFLQRCVGHRLGLRQTPHLRFAYDESIAEGARLEELFGKIERERDDHDQG